MDERLAGNNVVQFKGPKLRGANPAPRQDELAGIENSAMLDGLFSLLEGTPGLATITDINGRVLYMNERGRESLGISADEVTQRSLAQSYPGAAARYLYDQVIPGAMRNGTWRGEMTMLGRGGEEIPVSQVIIFQRTSANNGFLLSIAWDMREQKRTETLLRHRATHDELTGLPNRALIVDRMTQALKRSQRDKTLTAVVFLDLNGFKEINDTFGHESANRVLKEAADRFRSCTRSVDTVGRYGGDEFVFVLPNLRHADQVEPVLKRVRNVFAEPFSIGRRRVQLSTSIGVAIYPADGAKAGDLLDFADRQMYRQKRRMQHVVRDRDQSSRRTATRAGWSLAAGQAG